MTVLCHGDCHVWLGSSALCTCEVEMIFQGYNPFASNKLPANEVPLANLKAARLINGATHLSPDGLQVYTEMIDGIRVHYWDRESKSFGSSFPCDEIPKGAVKL